MHPTPKNLNILISILVAVGYGVTVCLVYILSAGNIPEFIFLMAVLFVACFWIKKGLTIPEGN
jgi:hypothetical protein